MERLKAGPCVKTMSSNNHPLIYMVFHTAKKDTPENRRVAIVTYWPNRVRNYLISQIRKGKVTYAREEAVLCSKEIQALRFYRDWNESRSRKELNRYLGGAFLDTAVDGCPYFPPEKRKDKKERGKR